MIKVQAILGIQALEDYLSKRWASTFKIFAIYFFSAIVLLVKS